MTAALNSFSGEKTLVIGVDVDENFYKNKSKINLRFSTQSKMSIYIKHALHRNIFKVPVNYSQTILNSN